MLLYVGVSSFACVACLRSVPLKGKPRGTIYPIPRNFEDPTLYVTKPFPLFKHQLFFLQNKSLNCVSGPKGVVIPAGPEFLLTALIMMKVNY